MINNQNQDVHVDYTAGDRFLPSAANQLAGSIKYDFVITGEVLSNYLDKHPNVTVIDVGDLITCDTEGNDGTWTGNKVPAPVSIYIAGKTSRTDGYCLDFGGKLLTDIVDCSEFQSGGDWDSALTKDMINVHSAYPYRLKELVAGVNFWSTFESVVSIVGAYATNPGITKVGVYATEGSGTLYDLGDSDYLQIVCKHLVSGNQFSISPTASHVETGYRAAVVVADWMTGNSSATLGYSIATTDTSKPGLFQQLTESIKYGSEPVVFIGYSQAVSYYHICYHGTSEMRFQNNDEGKLLVVDSDGGLTWSTLSSGGGGRAVILDTDTSDVIPYVSPGDIPHKYIVGKSNHIDELTVLRPSSGFISPQQDMDNTLAPGWYDGYPGFSFAKGPVTTLDWYFWYAISDFDDNDDTTLVWRKNTRLQLHVNIDSLREGQVYEIACHVISLPSGPVAEDPGYPDDYKVGNLIYGKQASPVTKYANGTDLDSTVWNMKPSVYFIDYTGGTPSEVNIWGLPGRHINNVIYPAFYAAPEPNYGSKKPNNVSPIMQLKDLARAKLLFTYLGGIVYVMAY